jgi:hypothetical protein|tara:strand:- start:4 stop:216 length:213 start_codon:yes stop_codon:yes gene_type:complete
MSKKITFEESLGESDWGLIIDKNGNLKGLFIPDGSNEDDVPDNIIQLCCQQFGINPNEFYGEEERPSVLH